jgi:hypothetical protein
LTLSPQPAQRRNARENAVASASRNAEAISAIDNRVSRSSCAAGSKRA